MHIGHTQEKRRKDGDELFFLFGNRLVLFIYLFIIFLIQHKEMQESKRKTISKKGRIEITLKEPPGRVDLPVSLYALGGRSSREMDLSSGH